MQSTDWAREHSDALREYFGHGMSFAEIAEAINARFNTAYSRSAVLGRAKRLGLARASRPCDRPRPRPNARLPQWRECHAATLPWPKPAFEPVKPLKLRCVDVEPRHVSLLDLEPEDCRYPYGGDEEGEAITFCGHPRLQGSSYCKAHFDLTCGPGTASERAADAFLLWLVQTQSEPSRNDPARDRDKDRHAELQNQ
jgi:GcrA cell cycle regulator